MTNRKKALTDLPAMVEAEKLWEEAADQMIDDAGLLKFETNIYDAYYGSFDAAYAMHEMLSPPISQYSIVTDPTCTKVSVCWWPDGLSEGRKVYAEGLSQSNPARAWLIAILRALIVLEGERDGN